MASPTITPTTTPTLYDDLKSVLDQFQAFLEKNTQLIKQAIQALSLIPGIGAKIGQLVDKLMALLTSLQKQIANITIPTTGLAEVAEFTGAAKTLLGTAATLLPDDKPAIDDVLKALDLVTGLPSFGDLQGLIVKQIGLIIDDLKTLKP